MTRPTQDEVDEGVLYTIVRRFQTVRLPHATMLKEKVGRGERLSDHDIAFLEEIFHDAHYIGPYFTRHPEYQALGASALALYEEITTKALKNEKAAHPKGEQT